MTYIYIYVYVYRVKKMSISYTHTVLLPNMMGLPVDPPKTSRLFSRRGGLEPPVFTCFKPPTPTEILFFRGLFSRNSEFLSQKSFCIHLKPIHLPSSSTVAPAPWHHLGPCPPWRQAIFERDEDLQRIFASPDGLSTEALTMERYAVPRRQRWWGEVPVGS